MGLYPHLDAAYLRTARDSLEVIGHNLAETGTTGQPKLFDAESPERLNQLLHVFPQSDDRHARATNRTTAVR